MTTCQFVGPFRIIPTITQTNKMAMTRKKKAFEPVILVTRMNKRDGFGPQADDMGGISGHFSIPMVVSQKAIELTCDSE
jgi:hypothetical protein